VVVAPATGTHDVVRDVIRGGGSGHQDV
jgi:hypothetical protein